MRNIFSIVLICCLAVSCKKIKKDIHCSTNASCNYCRVCIENNLDKELYWDKDTQNDHFDTIKVGATFCKAVNVNIRVVYDKWCTKTTNNYSNISFMIDTRSHSLVLDKCEKKFTAKYDSGKTVEVKDDTP